MFLIDGIGPFFQGLRPGKRVNWSKIPFALIEERGRLQSTMAERIFSDFVRFLDRSCAMGYNAVTLDDLAHLVDLPEYDDGLNLKIGDYQELFRRIMAEAERRGVRIFVTTDYMFFSRSEVANRRSQARACLDRMKRVIERFFSLFPHVAGIIFRIGETDGTDVADSFRSRLTIKTPKQANRMVKELLPEFEQRRKTMIFRLWTVGAYQIG
ncbi:MAG: glycosyl hydrolase family 67, partial [Verrucomicrobiota bacterium]